MLKKNISIRIEPRIDGRIRVWSPQIKGLILSGPDPEKVMADVWPAIVVLLTHRHTQQARKPE